MNPAINHTTIHNNTIAPLLFLGGVVRRTGVVAGFVLSDKHEQLPFRHCVTPSLRTGKELLENTTTERSELMKTIEKT